jgi:hypothetical protein
MVEAAMAGQPRFFDADERLRAGLQTASWIAVDDTGARHQTTAPARNFNAIFQSHAQAFLDQASASWRL